MIPKQRLRQAIFAAAAWAGLACTDRPARATEPNAVLWHRDVKTAWQSTQQQNRPLLVFVTTNHCLYCSKMKQSTLSNPAVVATINRSFVPLVLSGETPSPLLADLAVTGFPATFIISQEAVILARLDGYVPPETLMSQLAAVRTTASSPPAGQR